MRVPAIAVPRVLRVFTDKRGCKHEWYAWVHPHQTQIEETAWPSSWSSPEVQAAGPAVTKRLAFVQHRTCSKCNLREYIRHRLGEAS